MNATGKLIMPFDRRGDNAYLRLTADGIQELYYLRRLPPGLVVGATFLMYRTRDNALSRVHIARGAAQCSCADDQPCLHVQAIATLIKRGKA